MSTIDPVFRGAVLGDMRLRTTGVQASTADSGEFVAPLRFNDGVFRLCSRLNYRYDYASLPTPPSLKPPIPSHFIPGGSPILCHTFLTLMVAESYPPPQRCFRFKVES